MTFLYADHNETEFWNYDSNTVFYRNERVPLRSSIKTVLILNGFFSHRFPTSPGSTGTGPDPPGSAPGHSPVSIPGVFCNHVGGLELDHHHAGYKNVLLDIQRPQKREKTGGISAVPAINYDLFMLILNRMIYTLNEDKFLQKGL